MRLLLLNTKALILNNLTHTTQKTADSKLLRLPRITKAHIIRIPCISQPQLLAQTLQTLIQSPADNIRNHRARRRPLRQYAVSRLHILRLPFDFQRHTLTICTNHRQQGSNIPRIPKRLEQSPHPLKRNSREKILQIHINQQLRARLVRFCTGKHRSRLKKAMRLLRNLRLLQYLIQHRPLRRLQLRLRRSNLAHSAVLLGNLKTIIIVKGHNVPMVRQKTQRLIIHLQQIRQLPVRLHNRHLLCLQLLQIGLLFP